MTYKSVLVTGSMGYIGQNLCKYLISQGYSIIQYDKLIDKDISKINDSIISSVDGVIHLAAISGIKECENNFKEATIENVFKTMKIIDLCKEHKKFFIFASSQAAANLTNIYSIYKRQIEEYINFKYYRLCTSLRFSNVYGGINYLENKNTVIANFLNAVLNDTPLIINGSGEQQRDFIHVDYLCYYVHKTIEEIDRFGILKENYLDIGSGYSYSINDVVSLIKKHYSEYNIKVEYNKNGFVGVFNNNIDMTRTNEILKVSNDFVNENRLNRYIRGL